MKLGASLINTEASDSRIILTNDASTQAAVGFGVDMRFAQNWFARLEYDDYSQDANYAGLGLGYRFGGSDITDKKRSQKPKRRKPKKQKPLPVVIEYPIYMPEEQVTVLAEDRATVTVVADELIQLSEELVVASKIQQSEHMAKQADILTETGKRIAIVEESILRTMGVDPSTIDPESVVNADGDKLLITPAEQSVELSAVRQNISSVEKSVGGMPYVKERLARVLERIAVIEESLLFIPPWEEKEAEMLCKDFASKEQKIQFGSDSVRLTAGARRVLAEIAKKMNRNYRVVMEIHAHTDSWGTFVHNQQLSDERAQQTVDYLVEHGVAKARLVAQGHGELQPLDKNILKPGRAVNRRVELLIKNPNICK